MHTLRSISHILMHNIPTLLEDHNPWWAEPRVRRADRFPVRRNLHAQVRDQLLRVNDRRAVVIEGPRQVGKTVLLLQIVDELLAGGWPAANVTYFDFSDDRIVGPVSPRQIVDSRPVHADPHHPHVFLLDEIGRAERWDEWLKQAVDRAEPGMARFAVTDSASTLLRHGSRESGQGRWDLRRMEGLSFAEFALVSNPQQKSAIDAARTSPGVFERYLARGGYPEHAVARDASGFEVRERIRADIVDRAIRRDLKPLYDDPRVKDLFVYLVQSSGAVFDARRRADDLSADYRSLEAWRSALEDTLLIAPLDPYPASDKAKKRLNSRPKLYVADHGLSVAFSPLPKPLEDASVRAQVFEALVFRHLREHVGERHERVAYAAMKGGEIDFVVDGGSDRLAIEVTCSKEPSSKVRALHELGAEISADRLLLVHGGLIAERRGKVQLVPAADFALTPAKFLLGGEE
jgi:uncharacterized protein